MQHVDLTNAALGSFTLSRDGNRALMFTNATLDEAEILGQVLLSWHNIAFFQALTAAMRSAIAEGRFDAYPRSGPTSEWDTAAGQAILAAAGGCVTTLDKSQFAAKAQDPDFATIPVLSEAQFGDTMHIRVAGGGTVTAATTRVFADLPPTPRRPGVQ